MLALALLVLNANVFLAGLVAAAMKLVSIATAPIAFHLGVLLVDGPLQPVFRTLVNAPVTAWLGFDSYLAVGGLALGLFVGIGLGLVTWGVVVVSISDAIRHESIAVRDRVFKRKAGKRDDKGNKVRHDHRHVMC